MSIDVPLEELGSAVAARGDLAYLVTVGESGPRVVSVSVEVSADGTLAMEAGRHTSANAEARPAVSLLWPPDARDPVHTLLVDGTAEVVAEAPLRVVPTRAVLHRVRAGKGRAAT